MPVKITTNIDTSDKLLNIGAMDKNKPFPECAKDCELVKMLGVGECESVCGHKFDTSGRQLTIPDVSNSVFCPNCKTNDMITVDNWCMRCGAVLKKKPNC